MRGNNAPSLSVRCTCKGVRTETKENVVHHARGDHQFLRLVAGAQQLPTERHRGVRRGARGRLTRKGGTPRGGDASWGIGTYTPTNTVPARRPRSAFIFGACRFVLPGLARAGVPQLGGVSANHGNPRQHLSAGTDELLVQHRHRHRAERGTHYPASAAARVEPERHPVEHRAHAGAVPVVCGASGPNDPGAFDPGRDGVLIHTTILRNSTRTEGCIQYPSGWSHPALVTTGSLVTYMLRNRAPRTCLMGPVFVEAERDRVRCDPGPAADGQSIRIQSGVGLPLPQPNRDLIYLGPGRAPRGPCTGADAAARILSECAQWTPTPRTPGSGSSRWSRSTSMPLRARTRGHGCETPNETGTPRTLRLRGGPSCPRTR